MGRIKNFIEEETLDKAIELFQLQGYRTTSPEEIVKFLGISRSSLYATFGDKRGLLLKALNRYRKLTADSLEKITLESKDGVEGIERIFDISVTGCYHPGLPSGCFMVNSIIEFGPEDGDALQIVKDSYEDCRNALLHFVKMGKKSKPTFKKLNVETTTDYLINAISGMVVSAKVGMDEAACRRLAEQTLSVLK
ncbi:TetR/AcrR family transcriptional regulator [Mucilaginibacter sp. McL0603]|uniref:TetR/AcrR family transcriptional regulator n=1 Tax=Mucilaginibacter sp. McL0603 TaxID=3415670 RepID=UPI003CE70646